MAFVAMLAAVVLCGALALTFAQHVHSLSKLNTTQLSNEPWVMLPAQLAAYFILLVGLWRLFTHHFRIGFFRALGWHWPESWPTFLCSGMLLAISVEIISHFLPTPPELPIDKMMRGASDAWMLSVFGVLIAPFVEEVLFRGMLFPALCRRASAGVSLVATSVLFGAVHAQQLAGAWVQVAIIVVVGMILTAIRWRYHSLASSTLVHVGYNGTLFVALFVQTRGFTHFPGS